MTTYSKKNLTDMLDKADKVYESCKTDDQRLNALRYAELAGGVLMANKFIDPYKQIDYSERRTKGCFACHHSKREELNGKLRSFCRPIQDGIITHNLKGEPLEYPDESVGTCKWFVRKSKSST